MRKNHMAQVKKHLLSRAYLTPKEALDLYGCFRLASIVHRLRRKGLPIENMGKPGGHADYRIKRSYFVGQQEMRL